MLIWSINCIWPLGSLIPCQRWAIQTNRSLLFLCSTVPQVLDPFLVDWGMLSAARKEPEGPENSVFLILDLVLKPSSFWDLALWDLIFKRYCDLTNQDLTSTLYIDFEVDTSVLPRLFQLYYCQSISSFPNLKLTICIKLTYIHAYT